VGVSSFEWTIEVSNGGGSFKVGHWADAVEVMNVHKSGAQGVGEWTCG